MGNFKKKFLVILDDKLGNAETHVNLNHVREESNSKSLPSETLLEFHTALSLLVCIFHQLEIFPGKFIVILTQIRLFLP